jgi:hypothetical protein
MLVQPAIKSVKARIAYFNMVVGKWERGGSAKEILRAAGVGEARVALRLRELMMQNQNLTVAKDMAVHASKMLEMLNPLQDIEGFAINVTRSDKPSKPVETGPGREKRDAHKGEKVTITD